jgi:hypothetical protein
MLTFTCVSSKCVSCAGTLIVSQVEDAVSFVMPMPTPDFARFSVRLNRLQVMELVHQLIGWTYTSMGDDEVAPALWNGLIETGFMGKHLPEV